MEEPESSIPFSLTSMLSQLQGKEAPVFLTADQILEMQGLLMAEYKKAEFQAKLHRAWKEVGSDELARAKVQQALCHRVQLPIITKFGFEASEKGLAQMSKAAGATEHTPIMLGNQRTLKWLLDPEMQLEQPGLVLDAEVPVQGPEWIRPRHLSQRGSRWIVVGGTGKKGILVRRGESLESQAYKVRLCTGAELRAEEDVVGNRLHYKLLSGDGPDFGWVSIEAEGRVLVKPDIDGYVKELDSGVGVSKDGPEFQSNRFGMQYQLEKIMREQGF